MVDHKGEPNQKNRASTSPDEDPVPDPAEGTPQNPPLPAVSGAAHFVPPPLPGVAYAVPAAVTETSAKHKRTRYNVNVAAASQWKQIQPANAAFKVESTPPSPSGYPQPSSSNTATSSPSPTEHFPQQHQFRKGKFVSPVWKPNEMLWLARAWRVQYQGAATTDDGSGDAPLGRGKTRAEKDREVADFLNRHGVSRDAKTAGTKWDNMLGEFRKVHEWERENTGKSYFRLSPYDRKLHRLPASFDEEVFEELSQFMSPRMRSTTPQGRGGVAIISSSGGGGVGGGDSFLIPKPSHRSLMGLEPPHPLLGCPSSATMRRIGKIRMVWEESVSIWADEEGEHHRGRVKLVPASTFLAADELAFMDDSMVASTVEFFEDGPLKGFSVDRFMSGQHLRVFGRRRPTLPPHPHPSVPMTEKFYHHSVEPSVRSTCSWEFQDPTEYYVGCLRVPPPTLPSLFELTWYLQEPPPEELRFPLRKDVYNDLPHGKESFFTACNELLLDCRGITFDLLGSVMRSHPTLSDSSTDSFIGLWDDCVNRTLTKFCSPEMVFVRRKSSSSLAETVQDQWPDVTAFIRSFCLWRGEETGRMREGQPDPSSTLVEKMTWTYEDLPYVLGYYAVGFHVTFCALSRFQDRIIRTDLYTVDLSTPSERMKALVPCWRIAGLLTLLSEKCVDIGKINGDFERVDLGNGNLLELTPNSAVRYFSSKRKWTEVKEIYDFLDHRVPHAEVVVRSSEKDLALVFKPRGCRFRPESVGELVEALKQVTKALVALHDLSFMHRDLGWDKVMRRSDGEWFLTGFDEAVAAPQINMHGGAASGRHAPEMGRGLHGVKVDVWGVGQLVKTCGLAGVPKLLGELQNRCLDHNPEQRPSAADCYHHLLQLQSSMTAAAAAASTSAAGY
ncbi:hypothetical protein DM860_016058 [Cuscuta australis]|uniref:Protein kinase domain-containing protein n=1 Tax=Cuscuta australis TaxID=267555 RepID=A0A328E6F6_9ASTE|nr:hypothetical protein DM860_016058 [Cuscuta australis]